MWGTPQGWLSRQIKILNLLLCLKGRDSKSYAEMVAMSLRTRRGFLKAGTAALMGAAGAEGAQANAKEAAWLSGQGKTLPKIRVHPAGHFLETEDACQ